MTEEKVAENGVKIETPPPVASLWTTKRDGSVHLRMSDSGFGSEKPITLPAMVTSVVERTPTNHIALAVKRNGSWQKWTYAEFLADIRRAAKSFIKLGLGRFNGVGLLGFNSPEWYIGYLGAVFAGGLSVGIYTTNTADACKYVAEDSHCNIILVDTDDQLQKILSIWEELPHLKAVIQYTGKLTAQRDNVYTWADFLSLSEGILDSEVDDRINQQSPNTCCGLIYTSGTTGPPKAVMVSHDNATWTAMTIGKELTMNFAGEVFVSYLPLSHIAAQMLDLFMPISVGASIHFAQPDALKGTLGDTWREVRPTGVFGVPRVWEKIMERLQEAGRNNSWFKRKIASWAKGVGLKGSYAQQNGTPMPWGWGLANKLVFSNVAVALGLDRCRQMSSGGAPIDWATTEYFASLNMQFLEVYGSSENMGPVSFNKLGAFRLGSVGRTFVGTKTKLLPVEGANLSAINSATQKEHGEICSWGRNLFMGYLNKEDKTREVFTEDGYFRSGDIATQDKDGFWYITGRIKELVITAGGENVAPVPIEEAVKGELAVVNNCMVIGNRRKFLSLLITLKVEMDLDTMIPRDQLSAEALRWCQSVGSKATTVSGIISKGDAEVFRAIQAGIDRANAKAISRAARIQKWTILPRDFSVNGGELVPAMKVKRPAVEKMYEETVDAFYKE